MAMYPCLSLPSLSFPTLTGSIVTFNAQYVGLSLKSHKIALTATQSGSGIPSPVNERPINGYSAINIGAVGKNLFDNTGYFPDTKTVNYYYNGYIANENTIPRIELKAGVTYTFSFDIETSIEPFNASIGVGNGNYAVDISSRNGLMNGRNSWSFTPTAAQLANGNILAFRIPRYNTITSFTYTLSNIQLEISSTATSYEAYNGTTTTIPIGSIVYFGEHDARTGVLTATVKGIVYDGTEDWSRSGSTFRIAKPTDLKDNTLPVMCNEFNPTSDSSEVDGIRFGGSNIVITAPRFNNDLSTFVSFLQSNNLVLVYELATPTTIQLPPCPIDTFNGVNNIWADTGDTTLQYPKFG